MRFEDLLKPYSPETRGDLRNYLREYNCRSACNLFFGPEHYYLIRDNGWLVPGSSFVRVSRSPAPDFGYMINKGFMLTSEGPGEYNMSLMGAPKGVYTPEQALKDGLWTIYRVDLSRSSPQSVED